MEFNYTVTLEDLMRFGEHVYQTSPRIRRTKLFWCIFTPLFFAAWALQYYRETQAFDWVFWLIAFPAVSSALLLPRLFDRLSLKEIYRRYIVRPDADDSGPLRLVVAEDALTEISETRQTRLEWDQVYRVETLPDHIYVYASPDSGIVIPRHSFGSDRAYEDLQKEILKHIRKVDV